MTDIRISYNPFLTKTDLWIDGEPIAKTSDLYRYRNTPLENWEHIVIPGLVELCNDEEITLTVCSVKKYVDAIQAQVDSYCSQHRSTAIETKTEVAVGCKGRLNKLEKFKQALPTALPENNEAPDCEILLVSMAAPEVYAALLSELLGIKEADPLAAYLAANGAAEEAHFQTAAVAPSFLRDRHLQLKLYAFPSLRQCSNQYRHILKEKLNAPGDYMVLAVLDDDPEENDELFEMLSDRYVQKGKLNGMRYLFLSDDPEGNAEYLAEEYGKRPDHILPLSRAEDAAALVEDYLQSIGYFRKIGDEYRRLHTFLEQAWENARGQEAEEAMGNAEREFTETVARLQELREHYHSLEVRELFEMTEEQAIQEFRKILKKAMTSFDYPTDAPKATAVVMPWDVPSQEACVLREWNKKRGVKVDTGDVLFTYEVDGRTMQCKAPKAGYLLDTYFANCDKVPCLENVCAIGLPGEDFWSLRPQKAVMMPKEGIMGSWKKNVGDPVAVGDALFSYKTDKAEFECKSTAAGTLAATFFHEGDRVPCLAKVCTIERMDEEDADDRLERLLLCCKVDEDTLTAIEHILLQKLEETLQQYVSHIICERFVWCIPAGTAPAGDLVQDQYPVKAFLHKKLQGKCIAFLKELIPKSEGYQYSHYYGTLFCCSCYWDDPTYSKQRDIQNGVKEWLTKTAPQFDEFICSIMSTYSRHAITLLLKEKQENAEALIERYTQEFRQKFEALRREYSETDSADSRDRSELEKALADLGEIIEIKEA